MHLQAVIVPPPGVMDGALQALADIFDPDSAPVPVPRRSLLGRLRTSEAAATVPEVVWEPSPDAVFVRGCKFGNVTLTDAQSLVKAFEEAASTWVTPVVRVVDIHRGEAAPFSVTAASRASSMSSPTSFEAPSRSPRSRASSSTVAASAASSRSAASPPLRAPGFLSPSPGPSSPWTA